MDLRLRDRVAVVTGGSRGIGRAVVEKLADEGAVVVLCARTAEPLAAVADAARGRAADVLALVVDANDERAVAGAIERVLDRFRRVDVLVNTSGGHGVIKPIFELSDADWLRDFSQNFLGVVRFCTAVLPSMRARRCGSGSWAGRRPSLALMSRGWGPRTGRPLPETMVLRETRSNSQIPTPVPHRFPVNSLALTSVEGLLGQDEIDAAIQTMSTSKARRVDFGGCAPPQP